MSTSVAPPPAGLNLAGIWALFERTVAEQVRSWRLLASLGLFALPVAFAGVLRYFDSPAQPYLPGEAEYALILTLIPVGLLPLTSLLFCAGLVQDEVEGQTLTYLLTRPLPKWSIYAAKLLATYAVTAVIAALGVGATYAVVAWGQPDYWAIGGWGRLLRVEGIFALATLAYCGIFGLLGLMTRRSLVLGVVYILVLEGLVANIDFVIRKVTVRYYVRVLTERAVERLQAAGEMMDLTNAPETRGCILTLAGIAAVGIGIGSTIFATREFRLKTPEGA